MLCFKKSSHYMSKTGLFSQSCRHVLNWEGRTRVEFAEKIFEHAQVHTAVSRRSAAQLALHCLYSVQHAASRYYWETDWTEARLAWRSSTTECLLRGASLVSPLSYSVHTVLRSWDCYIERIERSRIGTEPAGKLKQYSKAHKSWVKSGKMCFSEFNNFPQFLI